MMDGSLKDDGKTPATSSTTSASPRKVVDMAHAMGVSVEGELGCLGSLETAWARRKTATAPRARCRTTSC